jgi:hypothetical protein
MLSPMLIMAPLIGIGSALLTMVLTPTLGAFKQTYQNRNRPG